MLSDTNLERSSQWGVYLGPGIGPANPTTFTITPPDSYSDWMEIYTVGPSYADGMAALHRPLLPVFYPDKINLSYEFDVMTDKNAVTNCQALEFECNYTDSNSWYYNMSMQLNYVNPIGMVQAFASQSNQWANTGIILSKLQPMVKNHFKVNYQLNTLAHTSSIVSLTVNDEVYDLPAQFQNVQATQKNPPWAAGLYCQFQLDLVAAGGTFSVYVKNVQANWE